ncbi:hypothetical protein FVE85_6523 [Porphyridium purpureum]|uniref:Uncharacterized protein n=1 Tax=Porphyridium purpureum TaxID=35688 RepID=A0A5J4Z6V5_PORPP|nr:hypothetical protein FVE85_6523 [Porphyridium purpureum]|eukprot:POR5404..scf295_1
MYRRRDCSYELLLLALRGQSAAAVVWLALTFRLGSRDLRGCQTADNRTPQVHASSAYLFDAMNAARALLEVQDAPDERGQASMARVPSVMDPHKRELYL